MKKIIKLIILAACLAIAAPTMAGFTGGPFVWNGNTLDAVAEVYLSDYLNRSNGGAFCVNLVSGSLTPSIYSGLTAPQTNVYTTFCVESNRYINLNTTYWASIDKNAYYGGVGSAGDPISNVTEWIYDQWRVGNPSGWIQEDIKNAIHYAEGEGSIASAPPYSAALTALGYPAGTLPADLGNASHTWALNLWSGSGFQQQTDGTWIATVDNQSQLITIPAPGAILLGGIGVALVGWLRRRKTR